VKHLSRVGVALETASPKLLISSLTCRSPVKSAEHMAVRGHALHVSAMPNFVSKQLLAVPLRTTKPDNMTKRHRVTWLHTKDPSKKREHGVLLGQLRSFEKKDLLQMRRDGFVPGVIQDCEGKRTYVKIDEKCLQPWPNKLNAGCKLFDVRIEGLEPMKCFMRNLHYDTVFEDVIYDVLLLKFEPEKGQQVLLDIPFVSVNTERSPGLRRGGLLNISMTKVKVICTSYDVPDKIEVDVGWMEVGDKIFVKNFKFPEGLVLAPLKHYEHDVILTVQQTRASLGKE